MTREDLQKATQIKEHIDILERAINASETGYYIYFQESPGSSVGISIDSLGEGAMRVLRNSCQDILLDRKIFLEQALAAI